MPALKDVLALLVAFMLVGLGLWALRAAATSRLSELRFLGPVIGVMSAFSVVWLVLPDRAGAPSPAAIHSVHAGKISLERDPDGRLRVVRCEGFPAGGLEERPRVRADVLRINGVSDLPGSVSDCLELIARGSDPAVIEARNVLCELRVYHVPKRCFTTRTEGQ